MLRNRFAISLILVAKLDVGVGDLVADVMGAERERYDIVGIMEFRMVVHHLRLDRHLHDERDRVAESVECEFESMLGALYDQSGSAFSACAISASVEILCLDMDDFPCWRCIEARTHE